MAIGNCIAFPAAEETPAAGPPNSDLTASFPFSSPQILAEKLIMRFRGGPCFIRETGTEKCPLEHRRDLNRKEGVHLGGQQRRMEPQCRIMKEGKLSHRKEERIHSLRNQYRARGASEVRRSMGSGFFIKARTSMLGSSFGSGQCVGE